MTPQQPSSSAGTSNTHRHTGPADTPVTGWLVDNTAVVQAAAYLCAGGFVVGLLTAAATVSWLLLAAALTADTATYGVRARRDRALCGCDPTALSDAAPRRIRTTRDAAPR